MPKIRIKQTPNSLWLRQRELGVKFPLGHSDHFHKTLYSSMQSVASWDHGDNLAAARHGGVFNLEYSPDGLVTCIYAVYRKVAARTACTTHSIDEYILN